MSTPSARHLAATSSLISDDNLNFSHTIPANVVNKLAGVNPRSIAFFSDWDWTATIKPPENPDNARFTPAQYLNFQAAADRFGKLCIITASGEERIKGFLQEHDATHGRLRNTILCSNSGHYDHDLSISKTLKKPHINPIPGMTHAQMADLATHTWDLAASIGEEFPGHIVSKRELCSAFVFTVATEAEVKKIIERSESKAVELFGEEGAKKIKISPKHWPNEGVFSGYCDFNITGSGKGGTTALIFDRIASELVGDPTIIVGGDSAPDAAMMEALLRKVPRENIINIAVGTGLREENEKFAKANGGSQLIDWEINLDGKEAVALFHSFISVVGTPALKRGAALNPAPFGLTPAPR